MIGLFAFRPFGLRGFIRTAETVVVDTAIVAGVTYAAATQVKSLLRTK